MARYTWLSLLPGGTMSTYRRATASAALLLVLGVGIDGAAVAATVLKCDARNLHTDKMVEFSVILDEPAATATINGFSFQNVRFSQYRIDGVSRRPEPGIVGIVRETSFKVDRVTGYFSFGDTPDTADGMHASNAQIEALNQIGDSFVSFIGKCAKAAPQF